MSVRSLCIALLLAMTTLGGAGPASAQGQAPTGAFEVPARPVWAGEVFDLSLAWRVHWSTFQNLDGELSWTSDPLAAEPWSAPALVGPAADGWATIRLSTRAMALQPGRVALRPAQQPMIVQTGVVEMEEYRRAVTGPVTVRSAAAALIVRALPPAPADFSGAVGRFAVESAVDKTELAVGESLTWTVAIKGVGNWPAIQGPPPRQASRDFEIVGAPKLTEDEGSTLFERTMREQVVLAPQRAGRYVLSAFEMVAFDPQAGRFVTLTAPAIELTIRPGPNGEGAQPDAAAASATDEDALPPMLKGEGRAAALPPDVAWLTGLALAPLALVAFWLSLALHRAWKLDPERAARAAHIRLQATLAALAAKSAPAQRRRLVRAWQKDTALRWKLGRAAPTPAAFGQEVGWSRLWAEAEAFLYDRDAGLPDDWAERARLLLAELGEPPGFAPKTAFAAKNLLPAACVAIALLVGAAPERSEAEPATSEAGLRDHLARDPLDWRARHNLAVALAARDRWDEAAGQAAIAWLHAPSAGETRALWLLAAQKAGYSLDAGASVPRPRGGWSQAIAIASPAAWRWISVGFVWLCVVGLGIALFARFNAFARGLGAASFGLAAVAAGGGLFALAALHAYGPVASPDAALVWKAGPLRPLPVDTPAESAPVQLPAGAAGRVDAAFLGWRRLRFDDGRAGWVRRENLIRIWPDPGR